MTILLADRQVASAPGDLSNDAVAKKVVQRSTTSQNTCDLWHSHNCYNTQNRSNRKLGHVISFAGITNTATLFAGWFWGCP
jgi:hypothetical protein